MKQKLKIDQELGIAYFKEFPIQHIFTTVKAGNMSEEWEGKKGQAEENRKRILELFNLSPESEIHIHPEFEDDIVLVDGNHRGEVIKCDGLVTGNPDIFLSIYPGDCFPIIITTLEREFVALIHGAWKAVHRGIVESSVNFIKNTLGINLEKFRVAIGPGIQQCHFDINVEEAMGELPEWWPLITEDSLAEKERVSFNLLGYIVYKLKQSGVTEGNIINSSLCTYCAKGGNGDPLFFSHRRAKGTEEEGRFLALAYL